MPITGSINDIMSLLQQVTSIDTVSSFLKSKNLKYSAGSWQDLRDKRVVPVIDSNELTKEELLHLLSEVEESGRQHVFLYSMDAANAQQLMNESYVRTLATAAGVADVIDNPKVLDKPEFPTFASIRWEGTGSAKTLIIKIIETRSSKKFLNEVQQSDILTVKYQYVQERAVSLIKVFYNGDIEVRIASQSNSKRYEEALQTFWYRIRHFVRLLEVNQTSLSVMKDKVWNDRRNLTSVIRFSGSTLRNDNGVSLVAATGSEEDDLNDDAGATASLESFIDNQGYCESSNIWFLPQVTGVPSKKIHVLLSGQNHEFAITMHCKKADYDYVIGKIRALNV